MKLSKLLKLQGLFMNDIKSRIKSRQVSVDGIIVKEDIDVPFSGYIEDAGEFVFHNIAGNQRFVNLCRAIGLEFVTHFSTTDPEFQELVDEMKRISVIKFSKKGMFVVG